MEWNEIGVDGQHTVKFTDLPYAPLKRPLQSVDIGESFVGKRQGGILRHGDWAWLVKNSVLQIVSLRNGQTISSYEFCESRGYENCCIKSVAEMLPNNPDIMLLAVLLESLRGTAGGCSYVAVYSVELCSVLSCIELSLHLTCACFMDASACRSTLLQNFDGCLAVGSEEGVIVLLDMNVGKLRSMRKELTADIFVPCHIVDYSLSLTEIHSNFRHCQRDGIYFGLQIEVIESPCSIKSILPIDLIVGLAIGLEDGRLALYDLAELQIFYVALPNPDVTMSALVKMDFLEPPDDPRPCLFIWAIHENGENLHAVLHNLMYEKRLTGENESSTYFESFQNCTVRLQLPLEATKSTALDCQSISTISNHDEDDSNCLCVITWLSVLERKNKLLVFDLNQWYKEEMPYVLEYGKQPNYLAGYILNGECTGLHTLLKPNSIAHFNSMQRFEEHFYPNSLSFESSLLHTEGCRRYNWEGAQIRVVNLLRSSNAAIFLEPNLYFNEILRTRLIPQFTEMNMNSTFSRNAKYEILLSAALEHNCVSLLRDCAKSWLDGSFMGNFSASTGLSLSTLTDWIWKRSTFIKTRCNDLCKSLFEFGAFPLDNREQKELGFLTRQLKLLTELLKEIVVYARKQIPESAINGLEIKYKSLSMASCYQDILLWLLNIGLLPETAAHIDKIKANQVYSELNQFYKNKRLLFAKMNENFISKKTGSCKLLFIDSFIAHVCKGTIVNEYWLENDGNGLYPPKSLEAMLRIMVVPDLDYDNKCAILLYFFLDLNMAIDEGFYKDVVANFIKFPSVFKLSAPLIKTVQAFWNLDHDQYLAAVDEFISPFNKNQCYSQWQVDLFIEVLLNQKASNLALRILESQTSLISPLLKLNTLLANGLISEAFHFVRFKYDDTLLETFFNRCLCNGHFGVIRDLALSEREGLVLQNMLRRSKSPEAESLHFIYLLQKSKYLEAVSYMEELSNKAKVKKSSLQPAIEMDTPNLVLSAFNTTITPVTQGLADVYFRIKNKIKRKEVDNKSPVPLSCQLIKQNANGLLGGIYHSSALSAHFATYYWGEMEEKTKQTKHILNVNNAPFLRRPQTNTNSIDNMAKNNISYPQTYKVTEKRTLLESGVLDNDHDAFERHRIEHKLNPKKKRRLIGQEIVENLTHFMKINKTANNFNDSEFNFAPEEISEKVGKRKNSLDVLTCPLINKSVKESYGVVNSAQEIHGILKIHTSSDIMQQQHLPLSEEEKNIRFQIPSVDINMAEIMQNDEIMDEEKFEIADAEEKLFEGARKSSSPKSTKVTVPQRLRRSSGSSTNTSEEDFYSPTSSLNNSKLDGSNFSKCSLFSGPQARKPLARYSSERSEILLTPEPETKVLDSNTAIKPESDLKSTISRDSLERFGNLDHVINTKVSPRKSLERVNADCLEKPTATAPSKELCVAATETFSKVVTYSQSTLREDVIPTSSALDSIGSHVTFERSKIIEFSPHVFSSKVGTSSQNAREESKPPDTAKLSECSTVLGSLTNFDSSHMPLDKTKSDLIKPTDEQKRQMLETTLSMSTYDDSIFDSTIEQQSKFSLMVMATDNKLESATAHENKMSELVHEETKEIQFEQQLEEKEIHSEQNSDNVIEIQKEASNEPQPKERSNSDCIILSSSSSSSQSVAEEVDDYSEGDENYDFEECNTSGINNEEVLHYDCDDDGGDDDDDADDVDVAYKKYLYMEESDQSNVTENCGVIQLIDDSSSDEQEEQANYCEESNSDDVKVVEDEQLHVVVENIATLNAEEEVKHEVTNTTCIEDKGVIKEAAVEILAPSTNNPPQKTAKFPEKSDLISTENFEKLPSTEEKASEIDIRISGNVGAFDTENSKEIESEDIQNKNAPESRSTENPEQLSISEIDIRISKNVNACISEVSEEIKSEDVKQSAVVISRSAENSEQSPGTDNTDSEINQNVIVLTSELFGENKLEEKKQQGITVNTIAPDQDQEQENTSLKKGKEVTSPTREIEPYEKEKAKLPNVTESLEITKAIEDEARKGRKENSLAASKWNIKSYSAIKDTNETERKDVIKEKSDVNEIEKKEIAEIVLTPMDLGLKKIDINSGEKAKPSKLRMEKDEIIAKNENAVELEAEEMVKKISEKKGFQVQPMVKEMENNRTAVITPRKRKSSRGSSVPPNDLVLSPCMITEDISVFPSKEAYEITPRSRRGVRASSLQPKNQIEETGATMPYKVQKMQDSERSEIRTTRGSSLPPITVTGKISTRRRSALLEAINEESVNLDSPATRTRLRSRLSSLDSEVDSPMIDATEQKRIRKTSMSNNDLTITPKRTRRDSINSQSETSGAVNASRTLRSRSVLSVQEDETESISASPSSVGSKKRVKSIHEEPITENKEPIEQIAPKNVQSALSEVYNSSARRLTRTQLSIMEKTAALTKAYSTDAATREAISPPTNKRPTKSRSTRSSNINADSDDTESISSKISAVSSVTGTKRRVTRSSIKEQDDIDDDSVSVASSIGSEKQQRAPRSKDKSSPNTTLTTIPEDEPAEAKKRGRPSKH